MASSTLAVIVVGGSIAGLCCAHSLLHRATSASNRGVENAAVTVTVTVLERAASLSAPPATGLGGGAGIGLDQISCTSSLRRWLGAIDNLSLPLSCEENRIMNLNTHAGTEHVVVRDEEYRHRAVHWGDLHRLLYQALPEGTVRWGHEVLSFRQTTADVDRHRVYVTVRSSRKSEDGAMSQIRQTFLPLEKRRYCGYCAWRGVLDSSAEEGMNIRADLRQLYPDLGHCLYFDINVAKKTHAVLYELTGNRLNWLWYVNQPEPNLKGSSVTMKADYEAISRMQNEASQVWPQELARLIKATPAPFINAIYDRDPVEQIVWGHVALVGDAVHPTSPHGLRSTNMSIADADVLGECIIRWGSGHIQHALLEYQSIRSTVTSQEVLFSRYLGLVKQGLSSELHDHGTVSAEFLLQRNMHSFDQIDDGIVNFGVL